MAMCKCPECGTDISTSASRCPKCGKKLKHTGLIILVFILVIILAFVSGCIVKEHMQPGTSLLSAISRNIKFDLPWSSYKNKTITAENHDEIMNEAKEKMKDSDELYYFTYAYLYYWAQGMQESYADNYDMNDVYKDRIYGKTINDLIKEGKQLMKDNNTDVEKFKQDMENFGNTLTIE